jgi:hypothetical protein
MVSTRNLRVTGGRHNAATIVPFGEGAHGVIFRRYWEGPNVIYPLVYVRGQNLSRAPATRYDSRGISVLGALVSTNYVTGPALGWVPMGWVSIHVLLSGSNGGHGCWDAQSPARPLELAHGDGRFARLFRTGQADDADGGAKALLGVSALALR